MPTSPMPQSWPRRAGSYRRDDEDEDPLDGAVNCFGCRFRRWAPDGFTCLKGLLAE